MKLWQKVSLICSVILIVVVTACSALLLSMAREELLTSAYEYTELRHIELKNNFLKELDHHAVESDSETVQHTLLHYCFSQAGEASGVLIVDEETVYSQLTFSPEDYLMPAENGRTVQYTGEINGREYYIVGCQTWISNLPGTEADRGCRTQSGRCSCACTNFTGSHAGRKVPFPFRCICR